MLWWFAVFSSVHLQPKSLMYVHWAMHAVVHVSLRIVAQYNRGGEPAHHISKIDFANYFTGIFFFSSMAIRHTLHIRKKSPVKVKRIVAFTIHSWWYYSEKKVEQDWKLLFGMRNFRGFATVMSPSSMMVSWPREAWPRPLALERFPKSTSL